MKFLDFTSLFEAEPASLAVMSTFQLDADFFEQRLLRCPALANARRIIVFMDAGQWSNLLRQDVPARLLNRRYLVVPVRPSRGVFHPKLNLLANGRGGQIQCGSNNLTRAGCSSNLEILNSFRLDLEADGEEALYIAQESYAFFKRACDDAEEQAGRIAREWLDELPKLAPWLAVSLPQKRSRRARLVHTYEVSLWDRVSAILDHAPPRKLLVMSPFHDPDARMAKRVLQRWPRCKIEFVVQQKTTNLPVFQLRGLSSSVSLFEIRNSSRRLHAKLVAWESDGGTGCLVGSANFTAAAFDALNIEACLLLAGAEDCVASLFDKEFGKKPVSFEDFDPGAEHEAEPLDVESGSLRLVSAVLTANGALRVTYCHRLKSGPTSLRIALRTPGEQRPRAYLSIPNTKTGTVTVVPPESALADARGTILASLVAEFGDHREESPPVWVIQEGRLTYESSGEGSSSTRAKVEETGEGLTEFLDELGGREGFAAVIEYLRHLSIRFHDGEIGRYGQRGFLPPIRDPYHPDVAPEWLLQPNADAPALAEAIYDFADRHEKHRLRKHAKRGNINGMENFLDIFIALIRILCVYHARGVVHRGQLIPRICRYLDVATMGFENDEDCSEGYLCTLSENLGDDADYLQEVSDELNLLGHLFAALVIVQKVRYVPLEQETVRRPSHCLPSFKARLKSAIKQVGLKEPPLRDVRKALEEYRMFSPAELAELEKEVSV